MPRTRFDAVPRDPLKELVFGRARSMGLNKAELARRANISTEHLRGLERKHSNEWRISDVLAFSSSLGIPMVELRENVGKR